MVPPNTDGSANRDAVESNARKEPKHQQGAEAEEGGETQQQVEELEELEGELAETTVGGVPWENTTSATLPQLPTGPTPASSADALTSPGSVAAAPSLQHLASSCAHILCK